MRMRTVIHWQHVRDECRVLTESIIFFLHDSCFVPRLVLPLCSLCFS